MRLFTWKRRGVLLALALATGAVLPAAGRTEPSVVSASPPGVSAPQAPTHGLVATDTVRLVQAKLNSYGYVLAVDGIQGPITTKAVVHWQRANGLTVDGIIGPQTLRSLGLGTTTPSAPAPGRYAHPDPVVERWHDAALAGGWSEAEWRVVACIIHGESRGYEGAYNGVGNDQSYGLMQLNTKGSLWSWFADHVSTRDALFDGRTNLRVAKLLSQYTDSSGWADNDKWRPWRSSNPVRRACFA